MKKLLNIEIKARCADPSAVRTILLNLQADFRGTDEQTDTYFRVANGRLKLREGNIENNLIFYERADKAGSKSSRFRLVKVEDREGLRLALAEACGVKVTVVKKREIYYIGNVKFHIDEVPGLGHFVEIEAGNKEAPEKDAAALQAQCASYIKQLGIREEDFLTRSYSDMLMEKQGVSG